MDHADELWTIREDEGEIITYRDSLGNEVIERMAPMPPRSLNSEKYDGSAIVRSSLVLDRFTGTEKRRPRNSDGLGSAYVDPDVGFANTSVPLDVNESNRRRLESIVQSNRTGVQATSANEQMTSRSDLYDGYNVKRHILRPRYRKPTNRENMEAVVFGPSNGMNDVDVGAVRSRSEHTRKVGSVDGRKFSSSVPDGVGARRTDAPNVRTANRDSLDTLARAYGAHVDTYAPVTNVHASAEHISHSSSRVRRDIALPSELIRGRAQMESERGGVGAGMFGRANVMFSNTSNRVFERSMPTMTTTKGESMRMIPNYALGRSDAAEIPFSHPDRRRRTDTNASSFGTFVAPRRRLSTHNRRSFLSTEERGARHQSMQLDGTGARDAIFRFVHPALPESTTSARQNRRGQFRPRASGLTGNVNEPLPPVRVHANSRAVANALHERYTSMSADRRWFVPRAVVDTVRRVWASTSRTAAAIMDDTVRLQVDDGRVSGVTARIDTDALVGNVGVGRSKNAMPKHVRFKSSENTSAHSADRLRDFDAQSRRGRSATQSIDVFGAVRSTIGRLIYRSTNDRHVKPPIRTELAMIAAKAADGKRERRLNYEEGTECRTPARSGVTALTKLSDASALSSKRQKQMSDVDAATIAASNVRATFDDVPSVAPSLHKLTHFSD